MLCEKCNKNNATVMYTQIINGKKSSINICSECAATESIFENFGSLLSFSPREEFSQRVCPVCSTSLAEFTRTGRAGCGECYKTFRRDADLMLKKIHGTSVYQTDKKEAPKKKPKSELEKLREALSIAIEEEKFEDAAKLRDIIRDMEKRDKNE